MKNKISSYIQSLGILSGCLSGVFAFADTDPVKITINNSCPDPATIKFDLSNGAKPKLITPAGTKLISSNFNATVTYSSVVVLESIAFISLWGQREGPYDVVIPKSHDIECNYTVGLIPTGTTKPINSFTLSINDTMDQYLKLIGPWQTDPSSVSWYYRCEYKYGECLFQRLHALY